MSGYTVAVARIGGCGGVQFSHQEYLTQNGFQMGCSKQGAVLTSLHVENWRVLSHMHATYTSRTGGASCVVPGVGNISAPDKGELHSCNSSRSSCHLPLQAPRYITRWSCQHANSSCVTCKADVWTSSSANSCPSAYT